MGSAFGVILILASVDVSLTLVSVFCFAAVVTVVFVDIVALVDVSISLISVFCFPVVVTVIVVDVVVVVGALQYKGIYQYFNITCILI